MADSCLPDSHATLRTLMSHPKGESERGVYPDIVR
jgi:hypothetical protein